jgi:hypothetical protein
MAPPFMNAYGLVPQILDKIVEAQQPERFTQDFLATKLGFSKASARAFIPLLKRIGFLSSNGAPTPLYSQFRNEDSRGAAMAQALRIGYKEIFERNEYAQDLTKEKLKNLVIEMTGAKPTDSSVASIVGTFENLKKYAKWDDGPAAPAKQDVRVISPADIPPEERQPPTNGGLNLSYTINLNLPETSDVEVFNAIFRSLKDNLLRG